jgi:ketosteroid isomerase-like protein
MRAYAIRLSIAFATFLAGTSAAGLLDFTPSADRDAAAREVLAVEREYIRAHTERDVAALERVLADDFTSFGGRVRKSHRLAMLANPFFKVASLVTEDVRVSVRGRSARVSGTARMSGSFRGRSFDIPRYDFTRTLEKRDGRWQIVACEFSVH